MPDEGVLRRVRPPRQLGNPLRLVVVLVVQGLKQMQHVQEGILHTDNILVSPGSTVREQAIGFATVLDRRSIRWRVHQCISMRQQNVKAGEYTGLPSLNGLLGGTGQLGKAGEHFRRQVHIQQGRRAIGLEGQHTQLGIPRQGVALYKVIQHVHRAGKLEQRLQPRDGVQRDVSASEKGVGARASVRVPGNGKACARTVLIRRNASRYRVRLFSRKMGSRIGLSAEKRSIEWMSSTQLLHREGNWKGQPA